MSNNPRGNLKAVNICIVCKKTIIEEEESICQRCTLESSSVYDNVLNLWNAHRNVEIKCIRLKKKIERQAEIITRLKRSRSGLKKENKQLREELEKNK